MLFIPSYLLQLYDITITIFYNGIVVNEVHDQFIVV